MILSWDTIFSECLVSLKDKSYLHSSSTIRSSKLITRLSQSVDIPFAFLFFFYSAPRRVTCVLAILQMHQIIFFRFSCGKKMEARRKNQLNSTGAYMHGQGWVVRGNVTASSIRVYSNEFHCPGRSSR